MKRNVDMHYAVKSKHRTIADLSKPQTSGFKSDLSSRYDAQTAK